MSEDPNEYVAKEYFTPEEVRAMQQITMVKVFSATKSRERNRLGEDVTAWLAEHPGVQIIDKVVTQSSDSEFHCISITLFMTGPR